MPTPFSHMVAITRLLADDAVPPELQTLLQNQRPAFMLGSVAPDARIDAPDSRAATHFYIYQEPIDRDPWRRMLDRYPALNTPVDEAHYAFVAGYVAHLAMDQMWTLDMLLPHFVHAGWGEDIHYRFLMLHTMLIDMDERDEARLPGWVPDTLQAAQPGDWLPFMPQPVLRGWQTLIYDQIKPGGVSKTLDIFGGRIGKTPQELRRLLDDKAWMQRELWNHVPRSVLNIVESTMYTHARASLVHYMREFGHVKS